VVERALPLEDPALRFHGLVLTLYAREALAGQASPRVASGSEALLLLTHHGLHANERQGLPELVAFRPRRAEREVCLGKIVLGGNATPFLPPLLSLSKTKRFSASAPVRPVDECAFCRKKGHWKKDCPELGKRRAEDAKQDSTYTPAKRSKAVRTSVSLSSSSEEQDTDWDSGTEVLRTFQARRTNQRKADALAAEKRKAEEDVIVVDVGPSKKKAKASPPKRERRSADPAVVEFVCQTRFPRDVVARHGVLLGSQAKQAIKQIWDEEQEAKRKKKKSTAKAHLSHALVVSRRLNGVPCDNLVIDPGASTTLVGLRKAQEANLSTSKKCKYLLQLVDGSLKSPEGQTKHREIVEVRGTKVKLRMPVVDAKGSYDILLGRDWLSAMQAVGDYKSNTYRIQKDGIEVVLQGRKISSRDTDPGSSTASDSTGGSDVETESEDGESRPTLSAFRAVALPLKSYTATAVASEEVACSDSVVARIAENFRKGRCEHSVRFYSPSTQCLSCDLAAYLLKEQQKGGPPPPKPSNDDGRPGLPQKYPTTIGDDEDFHDDNNHDDLDKPDNCSNKRLQLEDSHPISVPTAPHPSPPSRSAQLGQMARYKPNRLCQVLLLSMEKAKGVDINPALTPLQRQQVEQLLWEFRDRFASSFEDLEERDIVEHAINLKPGICPYYCPYTKRLSRKELEFYGKRSRERWLETSSANGMGPGAHLCLWQRIKMACSGRLSTAESSTLTLNAKAGHSPTLKSSLNRWLATSGTPLHRMI